MKVAITEQRTREFMPVGTKKNRGKVQLANRTFYGKRDGRYFQADHRHAFAQSLKAMKY